jgi:hypothetical protein
MLLFLVNVIVFGEMVIVLFCLLFEVSLHRYNLFYPCWNLNKIFESLSGSNELGECMYGTADAFMA